MKRNRLIIALVIVIGIVLGLIIWYTVSTLKQQARDSINSYDTCAAAGYPLHTSHPMRCVGPDGKSFTQPTPDQESPISVQGKIVCLLHKNTEGPQTMECATGLKTADGKYYSLIVSRNDLASSAGSDKSVNVTGTFKKEVSTIYQTEGVILVDTYETLP